MIGIIGILFPASIGYALLSWVLVLIFTGFVGLGTIIASIVLVISTHYIYPGGVQTPFGIFAFLMCVFIIFTHRSNIYSMIKGEENQFTKAMLFKKYLK